MEFLTQGLASAIAVCQWVQVAMELFELHSATPNPSMLARVLCGHELVLCCPCFLRGAAAAASSSSSSSSLALLALSPPPSSASSFSSSPSFSLGQGTILAQIDFVSFCFSCLDWAMTIVIPLRVLVNLDILFHFGAVCLSQASQ